MSAQGLPELKPLGPVWKTVRKELGLTQTEVGEVLGLAHGQAAISNREQDPSSPNAVPPAPVEIARFEDRFGLQRGTVLRRAGYVIDPQTPLEQIDSWSFLSEALREAIKRMVQPEWEKAGHPGRGSTLRSVQGRRR